MALNLIQRQPHIDLSDIFLFREDATMAGFTNYTMTADRFVIPANFPNSFDYKINARGGNDTITTSGGDDIVYGGSGKDVINTGKGEDDIHGGSGDDRLNGGDQNDTIHGDAGIDVINGGANNDTITGGLGNDTLTGGSGSDMFMFNLGSGVDTITDFTQGQDKIYLGGAILQNMPDTYQGAYDIDAVLINVSGGVRFIFGNDPNNHRPVLIFDDATDMLSYDADGLVGDGEAVDLMKFENITSLSASDFWAPAPF